MLMTAAATHLLKRAAPLRALAARPAASCRPLARPYGLGSNVGDNNPNVLEHEKARNLSGETEKAGEDLPGAVPGVGGWNPRLASDAEAVVKAERAPDMEIEELVEFSVHTVFNATAATATGTTTTTETTTTTATMTDEAAKEEGPGGGGGHKKGKGKNE
jgi:hypothetical protein